MVYLRHQMNVRLSITASRPHNHKATEKKHEGMKTFFVLVHGNSNLMALKNSYEYESYEYMAGP